MLIISMFRRFVMQLHFCLKVNITFLHCDAMKDQNLYKLSISNLKKQYIIMQSVTVTCKKRLSETFEV